uniref:Uncharacterized protein n=1 Tax=Arundo donax TaxID=35708 RepID=A0A0A9FQC7_ARUDO
MRGQTILFLSTNSHRPIEQRQSTRRRRCTAPS